MGAVGGDKQAHERNLERIRRDCGPLIVDALKNDSVVEIMRNADGKIWFDVAGQGLIDTGARLSSESTEAILNVSATLLQTTITRENPILEGEFPLDGSRLEGLIHPVVQSPIFAIRKKAIAVFTLDDYAARGMLQPGYVSTHARSIGQLQPDAREALGRAVERRDNILVVGGTSSGKTTLANAVMNEIAIRTPHDRMGMIEDTMEIQLTMPNHVLLRTSEHVSMQRLLRAMMRLRPDRVGVGEVRGAEAYALNKAWNSGHPGGLATIHANSAIAGLTKFGQYMFEAEETRSFTGEMVGQMIASTVNVVLFIEKISGAPGRVVSEISRVCGYEKGQYVLEPLCKSLLKETAYA
jgi:type IV secretion system protein VirB11